MTTRELKIILPSEVILCARGAWDVAIGAHVRPLGRIDHGEGSIASTAAAIPTRTHRAYGSRYIAVCDRHRLRQCGFACLRLTDFDVGAHTCITTASVTNYECYWCDQDSSCHSIGSPLSKCTASPAHDDCVSLSAELMQTRRRRRRAVAADAASARADSPSSTQAMD